jgi:2-methylcitrate dehydratase PrpD
VDAKIQTMCDAIVGTRNANIYGPRNIEELQYSLPAQMALSALNMGNGYKTHRDYLEGRLQLAPDSDVLQLARRIKLHVDTDLDQKYPRHFVADVTVQFRDGTSQHVFQERATGSPTKPFTRAEHQVKLDELTDEVIGRDQAAQLFDMIDRLEPGAPVGDVTSLLRRR